MGVAAPSSVRRVHGTGRRARGRAVHRTPFRAEHPRSGRLAGRWGIAERTTLWDKLHDDRALIGLKILLLACLFLLAALLEWTAA